MLRQYLGQQKDATLLSTRYVHYVQMDSKMFSLGALVITASVAVYDQSFFLLRSCIPRSLACKYIQ